MLPRTGKVALISAFLVLSFLLSAAISLSCGAGGMDFAGLRAVLSGNADESARLIIEQIRLPRLAAGIIAGASLSLAGGAMQSLFRNPLADPSILGVSSGAALGAVLAMTVFAGAFATEICALFGGLTAAFAVYKLGAFGGRASAFSTLLAGIAVNAFCGAIVGFFMYSARDVGLRGYVFWSLGSLDRCGWPDILARSRRSRPVVDSDTALRAPAQPYAPREAAGVPLGRKRRARMGSRRFRRGPRNFRERRNMRDNRLRRLVVPHMVRTVSGPDNRVLLPLSAIGGATILALADAAARLWSPSDPVPIGVVTALLGAPFFLALLKRAGDSADD